MNALDSILFSSKGIGCRQAPNRVVANPVERNMGSEDGGVSDESLKVYEELARGRWGVVNVESTAATSNMGHRGPGAHALMLNCNTADSFRRLVDRFKNINQDALLFIQLSPGSFGLKEDLRAIPSEDITKAKLELVDAMLLAQQVGFDGVDCKQCHGSFPARLIARSNTRADEWGGSTVEARSQFVVQAVTKARNELTGKGLDEFIIGTRVSEIDVGNLVEILKVYESRLLFDFINVSISPLTNNAHAAFALSQSVKLMGIRSPVIASAGTDAISETHSFERVTDLMTGNLAPDFIGFGMQSIADPLMPMKLMRGEGHKVNWCNKCEGCIALFKNSKAVACVL
ncbi:MAG: hypothetical protein J7L76_05130 [Spirochaetaceae bacterium]|nr:hypothetical protein [Spirochaetaceae bacterium]